MKYSPIAKKLTKNHYGKTVINWFLKGEEASCAYHLFLGKGEYQKGSLKTTRDVWESLSMSDLVWDFVHRREL